MSEIKNLLAHLEKVAGHNKISADQAKDCETRIQQIIAKIEEKKYFKRLA